MAPPESPIRIGFVGGTARARRTLEVLGTRPGVAIVCALFQRGHADEHAEADRMAELARSQGIPYLIRDAIDEDAFRLFAEFAPAVVLGGGVWRAIVPTRFLELFPLGYMGLHGSALPEYRGFAGIYWQIINGESFIRMRFLQLGEGIDDGALVCTADGAPLEYRIDIDNELHLAEIFARYEEVHVRACCELIERLQAGNFCLRPQDERFASYACHRGPADGEIDWRGTTRAVFDFIRAQSRPAPGAFTYYHGRKVKIWRARPRPDFANYRGRICGKVVLRTKEGSVVILTGDGGIEVLEAETAQGRCAPSEIFHSVRERCRTRSEAIGELLLQRPEFASALGEF